MPRTRTPTHPASNCKVGRRSGVPRLQGSVGWARVFQAPTSSPGGSDLSSLDHRVGRCSDPSLRLCAEGVFRPLLQAALGSAAAGAGRAEAAVSARLAGARS